MTDKGQGNNLTWRRKDKERTYDGQGTRKAPNMKDKGQETHLTWRTKDKELTLQAPALQMSHAQRLMKLFFAWELEADQEKS